MPQELHRCTHLEVYSCHWSHFQNQSPSSVAPSWTLLETLREEVCSYYWYRERYHPRRGQTNNALCFSHTIPRRTRLASVSVCQCISVSVYVSVSVPHSPYEAGDGQQQQQCPGSAQAPGERGSRQRRCLCRKPQHWRNLWRQLIDTLQQNMQCLMIWDKTFQQFMALSTILGLSAVT